MKLPNKVYDILKWVTILFLPAIAVLYKSLAAEWGLPYAEQIYNSVFAVHIFLGSILGISSLTYNKEANDGEA